MKMVYTREDYREEVRLAKKYAKENKLDYHFVWIYARIAKMNYREWLEWKEEPKLEREELFQFTKSKLGKMIYDSVDWTMFPEPMWTYCAKLFMKKGESIKEGVKGIVASTNIILDDIIGLNKMMESVREEKIRK